MLKQHRLLHKILDINRNYKIYLTYRIEELKYLGKDGNKFKFSMIGHNNYIYLSSNYIKKHLKITFEDKLNYLISE